LDPQIRYPIAVAQPVRTAVLSHEGYYPSTMALSVSQKQYTLFVVERELQCDYVIGKEWLRFLVSSIMLDRGDVILLLMGRHRALICQLLPRFFFADYDT
jgi:hypothetical protein